MMASECSLTASTSEMLRRLRVGQRWLTEQHRAYLAEDPAAASDEKFSIALAAWDQLERVFRCSGYQGCIWGEGQRCPKDAPVICDQCVDNPEVEPSRQLSMEAVHGT